ncbi:MAG: hypothetical protein QOD01_2490, partial [Actinomycetota bacterium]|nr:hypothetical protein [Actinomycetota bacterium]
VPAWVAEMLAQTSREKTKGTTRP